MDSTGRPSSNDDKISDSTNRIHSNLKLLDGEKVYERITPHFLSFYNLYLVWIYIIFLSVLFILYYDTLVDNMEWFTSIITNVFALPTGNMGILSGVGMFDTLSILINVVTGQTLSILHAGEYALAVLWLIPIALFSTAFSILRIELKWIAVMIGVGLASIMIMVLL